MPTDAYTLISGDHAYFDNVETFTLTPMNGTEDVTVQGQRQAMNLRAAAGGTGQAGLAFSEEFGIDTDGGLFVIWSETFSLVPVGGDKITDADGTVWTIQIATVTTWRTRWKCVCTKDRE